MDINIFTQIGFIVLVGLACKNAILIVEFAKARREEGVPRYQATLDACMLRLRPIMMTSFAFILGVVPLVLSEGAGSEMRRALGTAVFSGMLGVTLFGIFLTPVFFHVIEGLGETRLLSSLPVRWIGSVALGVGVGVALGFFAIRLGMARPIWAEIVGGCFGALASLMVLGLRRRWRPVKSDATTGGPRP
jgi:multidrug efflux pump